jgi:hypothetical protein
VLPHAAEEGRRNPGHEGVMIRRVLWFFVLSEIYCSVYYYFRKVREAENVTQDSKVTVFM